jgi:hypothetical protein
VRQKLGEVRKLRGKRRNKSEQNGENWFKFWNMKGPAKI